MAGSQGGSARGGSAPESSPLAGTTRKLPEVLAGGRFNVSGKLGSGCFGEVWVGVDHESGEAVAVKFEEILSGFLDREVAILQAIQQSGPQQGFARLIYSGREAGGFTCMVMELLGDSLLQRLTAAGGSLAPKTVVLVAEQALHCLEYLHSKGVVHRDVKPENFLTGRGARTHHLYLIDFGLSAEFYFGRSHVEQRQLPGFHGNFRYASLDAHQCMTQSRRSDLEALGYMLIFMLAGRLPWSGLSAKDWRVKNRQILEMKTAADPAVLAGGMPAAFGLFLSAARGLAFQDRPDYDAAYDLFAEAREALGDVDGTAVEDHHVEWVDTSSDRGDLAPLQFAGPGEIRQPDDPSRWTLPRLKSFRSMRSGVRSVATARSPDSDQEETEVEEEHAGGRRAAHLARLKAAAKFHFRPGIPDGEAAGQPPPAAVKTAPLCFPSRLCGRHVKVSEPTLSCASTRGTSPSTSERISQSSTGPSPVPPARPGP
eukprot:CAMPEP_0170280410 /NCGR_PEP_ID=MMETSP0116_2-20130129/40218_1 /TAXON_ID=400756 /ORGANISM="Durinskia baltica, Strain CSIRO CS-38" /LENGTH=483 /DNA_ID=CAMNT_0010531739 /DNA_START=48 /DNA_END=1496 /DNA_ORIENTATION=-